MRISECAQQWDTLKPPLRISIDYMMSRKGDIRVSVGAPHLAQRRFNLRAQESLATGLKRLIDYEAQVELDAVGVAEAESKNRHEDF